MNKIIISGSIKLQKESSSWIEYFSNKNFDVIDSPKIQDNIELSEVYRNYYRNIEITDFFFLINEDRNGIKGYVGASGFAELTYAVMQNQIHNKNIQIYILNKPEKSVQSYFEINYWLENGWIKIFDKNI